jgi:hypothetical protein
MKFEIFGALVYSSVSAMSPPATSFDDYIIDDFLGHGAFGAVHEAKNKVHGKVSKVALKRPITTDGVTIREAVIMKVFLINTHILKIEASTLPKRRYIYRHFPWTCRRRGRRR